MHTRYFPSGPSSYLRRLALADARHGTEQPRQHIGASLRPSQRQPLHADDPVARAVARRILTRVGIPPLLAAIVLLAAFPHAAHTRDKVSSAVRSQASARAVILSDSVRLQAGRVVNSRGAVPSPRESWPPLQRSERICDTPVRIHVPCRMIVIHLP